MTGRVVSRALSVAAGALCLLLATIGAVLVPSLLPVSIVVGGVVGVAVYVVTSDRETNGPPRPARSIRHRAALAGAGTTAGCLVLTGLVSVLGAAAGPVLLLLFLALALWAWRARRHIPGRAPAPEEDSDGRQPVPHPPPPLPELLPDAGELPTPALCMAWQRSYFALLDLPDGPARQHIATLRRNLLDELERRDPAGFDHWLRNGARAGSDPSRYMDLTSDH